jgi:hypothetical protein
MIVAFLSFIIAGLDPAIYLEISRSVATQRAALIGEDPMVSVRDNSYRDWRAAVDRRLHQIYRITIADAGIDEEYLINCWSSNEEPLEFVEWFGNKFDLDPIPYVRGGSL